jgi:peptidoglycan/LPS O-acetylase OafA/YrhL
MAEGTSRRLGGLDALRGYAAVSVMLLHAGDLLRTPWLMPSGYLAVDLFFVMSGFVIGQAYDAKMPRLGFWGFLRVRLIRLYPLYILGLGVGALLGATLIVRGLGPVSVIGALLANMVFLPAPASHYSGGHVTPLDGPGWSLLFELWINVAYAIFYPRLSTKVLALISGAAAMGLLAATLAGTALSGGPFLATLWVGALRVCFSFPLGLILYRLRARLPDLSRGAPLVLPVLLLIFSIHGAPPMALIFILLVSPALVIVSGQAKASSALSVYGASASYCLYAIHQPVFELLGGTAHVLHIDPRLFAVGLIVGLLIMAPMIDRFYDRPIRRWFGTTGLGRDHHHRVVG